MENKKEIMKQVWNDIFNNEHCTCRDFEDYWNWKMSEKEDKEKYTIADNGENLVGKEADEYEFNNFKK
tara:strand:+ start:87 stop:290 length:204 start_codon:yes stop_codon:yes gene_type:complete